MKMHYESEGAPITCEHKNVVEEACSGGDSRYTCLDCGCSRWTIDYGSHETDWEAPADSGEAQKLLRSEVDAIIAEMAGTMYQVTIKKPSKTAKRELIVRLCGTIKQSKSKKRNNARKGFIFLK